MAKLMEDNLDPKVKKKWLAALRSRQFNQTIGVLKSKCSIGDSYFCCLGVLREISPGVKKNSHGKELLAVHSCGISTATQELLADKNDEAGWGFKRIANWIERHL